MATTSRSSSERESDSEEKFKNLKRVHEETAEECDKLEKKVFELKENNFILEKENEFSIKKCSKLEETLSKAPPTSDTIIYKYEKAFQKFLNNGLERSKMASMIYRVIQNKKKGIGYDSDEDDLKPSVENKSKSPFSYHYTPTQTHKFNNARKSKVFRYSRRTNPKEPNRFWYKKKK
ncbi:hypothetical protein KIW84_030603 [Lathyrus oleraceus]|uniref:Uncharacterized protein n=1 Tax=Pisum sativum TaxID=3888 RepID=A0A9D5AZI4_PEA|nr:hypothetical protein KIW84_030603 [Pisum sativum]